ncbi:interleukin 19 like [Brienomyrus brachyistius]|uniref:interleukin 19 like n=1 Tax=Brienomyrus brachyistius TaxID=42636 RepID=UPI0020B329FA|nr:interleukin 19 like [Brienomyrus brachyistius]
MDTRASHATTALLLLGLITAGHPLQAAGRLLLLGDCAVTVHTYEMRRDFTEMRQIMVTDDKHISTRLLTRQTMKELQPLESCCFLKHLLGFYVERVFSSYATNQSQFRRNTSNLANSFLSIRNDLRKCHAQMRCECGEDSKARLAAIHDSYEKLEPQDGAVKAIGELDSLLEWMETFGDGEK